jgi:LmbE family N-acetylglucosaminyl deacetylase
VAYGRSVAHLWSGTLQHWTAPLLWVFVVTLVVGVAFGIVKVRGLRQAEAAEKRAIAAADAQFR